MLQAFLHFERSDEVDKADLEDFADSARHESSLRPNTLSERKLIEEAMQYVDAGKEEGEQWKRIGASLNKPIEKFKRKSKGNQVAAAWGKATAVIHASSELVLAWLWTLDSNERLKNHIDDNGDLIRRIQYLPNSRTQLGDIGYSFPSTSRLFSVTNVWGKTFSRVGNEVLVIAGKTRD